MAPTPMATTATATPTRIWFSGVCRKSMIWKMGLWKWVWNEGELKGMGIGVGEESELMGGV